MPFTPKSFRARHNKKLTPAQSEKAAKRSNAMIREGLPEGEAIRNANAMAKRERGGRKRTRKKAC